MLGEGVAHVGTRTVAVLGHRRGEYGDAAGAVTLVEDGFDRLGFAPLPRALRDRALNVLLRHARFLGLANRQFERRVADRIAAAVARRDRDRARQLRELRAPARVDDRLLVL